jgi:hypothetical protein
MIVGIMPEMKSDQKSIFLTVAIIVIITFVILLISAKIANKGLFASNIILEARLILNK